MSPKLRLDEYSYISRANDDKVPFVDIVFKYDEEYCISFRVEGKTVEMSVEQHVPVEIVQEAIEVLKNRLLDFYDNTAE